MRIRSVVDLQAYLQAERPLEIEFEYHESDVSGSWGQIPEEPLVLAARTYGYECTSRSEGGRAPFFGWQGRGKRYVVFTLKRQNPQQQATGRFTPTAGSPEFLRIWSATYLLDAASSTHTSRTVSGMTREEVMATAWRRSPAGSRLVYIAREGDLEPIWREEDGFTPAADVPYEYRNASGAGRFLDVPVGGQFSRDARRSMTFEKLDDRHACNIDVRKPFEMDPYDDAWT